VLVRHVADRSGRRLQRVCSGKARVIDADTDFKGIILGLSHLERGIEDLAGVVAAGPGVDKNPSMPPRSARRICRSALVWSVNCIPSGTNGQLRQRSPMASNWLVPSCNGYYGGNKVDQH